MSALVLTKLLELHLVHDPDKGEAAVVLLAAAGEERVRYTIKGRYGHSEDEPTASLDYRQATYDASVGLARTILPFGLPRFAVDLVCHMEAVEVTRERLPASTDEVDPPSGDEINKPGDEPDPSGLIVPGT